MVGAISGDVEASPTSRGHAPNASLGDHLGVEASPGSVGLHASSHFLGPDAAAVDAFQQDCAAAVADLQHDVALASSSEGRLGVPSHRPLQLSSGSGLQGPAGRRSIDDALASARDGANAVGSGGASGSDHRDEDGTYRSTQQSMPVLALKGVGSQVGVDAERRLENKINSVNHRLIIRVAELEERVQQTTASESNQARLRDLLEQMVEGRCGQLETRLAAEAGHVAETEKRLEHSIMTEAARRCEAIKGLSARADAIDEAISSSFLHADTIGQLKADHGSEIAQLKADHEQRVSELGKALEALRRSTTDQDLQREREWADRLSAMQRDHQGTLQRCEASSAQEVGELRGRMDRCVRDIAALRQEFSERNEDLFNRTAQFSEQLHAHRGQNEDMQQKVVDLERLLTSSMAGQTRRLEELQFIVEEQEGKQQREMSQHGRKLQDLHSRVDDLDVNVGRIDKELRALSTSMRAEINGEIASAATSLRGEMHDALDRLEVRVCADLTAKMTHGSQEAMARSNEHREALFSMKMELQQALDDRASDTLEEAARGARQCAKIIEESVQVDIANAKAERDQFRNQTLADQKKLESGHAALERACRALEQRVDESAASAERDMVARERRLETAFGVMEQRQAALEQRCSAHEQRHLAQEQRLLIYSEGLEALTSRCSEIPDLLEAKMADVRAEAREDLTASTINAFHGEVKLWSSWARLAPHVFATKENVGATAVQGQIDASSPVAAGPPCISHDANFACSTGNADQLLQQRRWQEQLQWMQMQAHQQLQPHLQQR